MGLFVNLGIMVIPEGEKWRFWVDDSLQEQSEKILTPILLYTHIHCKKNSQRVLSEFWDDFVLYKHLSKANKSYATTL